MCKAHVLRFSCAHGLLMGFEPCRLAPCPVIKSTGVRLPQQPYRCYNCQHKLDTNQSRPPPSRDASYASSTESLESGGSLSSSPPRRTSSPPPLAAPVCHPLPGVVRQPSGCVRMSLTRPSSAGKSFSFSCNSSNHYPTPHYSGLPNFLPHQDHPCPPCQLEELRQKADRDVTREAKVEYPSLTGEMLVRNGMIKEWQAKPTLDKYVDERRTEEREMWLHVGRKWTQDLKKARVLVAEEDGLGLLG